MTTADPTLRAAKAWVRPGRGRLRAGIAGLLGLRAPCAALIAAATLSLAGCTGLAVPMTAGLEQALGRHPRIAVPPDEIAALAAAPSCCESLATLPYREFPREGTLTLDIDARTPAFDFETGKSRFAAFRLPDWQRPIELEVVSRVSAWRPEFMPVRTVFNPAIVLLDAGHRIVRRWQAPDAFTEQEITGQHPAIEVRGRVWIDVPASEAAYLLVHTTDALRARTAAVRGMPVDGFSPEGLVDLSLRSAPFVTLPVRFRAQAHAAEPGTLPRLALHEDLLVVDDRGVQFAERRDDAYVPAASIPFERIVAVRLGDGFFGPDRLVVSWLEGDTVRTRRFGLVRDPEQGRDALQPVVPAIEARIRPAWHRERVGIVADETVPDIVFLDPHPTGGAADRIRDSAMTGGAVTAGICGLCYGGTCPPQVLASCAGLFALGAVVGTAVGVGHELGANDARAAQPPVLPAEEIARSGPVVRSGVTNRLSPAALAGCVRAAGTASRSPADARGGGTSAGAETPSLGWRQQGRQAVLAEAGTDADLRLRMAVTRVELVGQASGMPPPGSAPAPASGPGTVSPAGPASGDWSVRLVVVARVGLTRQDAPATPPTVEVRWEGADAPLQRWGDPGDDTLARALDAACEGLAARILAEGERAWRALMPGDGALARASRP